MKRDWVATGHEQDDGRLLVVVQVIEFDGDGVVWKDFTGSCLVVPETGEDQADTFVYGIGAGIHECKEQVGW